MSPTAYTSPSTPLTFNRSSTATLPSFSSLIPAEESSSVSGLAPTPSTTTSAGRDLPDLSRTAPIRDLSDSASKCLDQRKERRERRGEGGAPEGTNLSSWASMWNLTPLPSWNLRMPLPMSLPRIASNGAVSIPTTSMFALCPKFECRISLARERCERIGRTFEAATATSIPMNELPTTTNRFFSPSPLPIAWSIFLASSMFLNVKMPFRSDPSIGKVLAREPVERMRWE